MYYEYLIKRLVPFSIGFLSAVFVTSLFQTMGAITATPDVPAVGAVYYGSSSSCRNKFKGGSGSGGQAVSEETPLAILHKPRPGYTAEARENGTEGTVRLRVTFEADGEVTSIEALNHLGDGLTERAVAAAKEIGFRPAIRHGVPVATTKVVEYTFTIY